MTRWEHRIDEYVRHSERRRTLAARGDEGWQLCGVVYHHPLGVAEPRWEFFFKRPLAADETA